MSSNPLFSIIIPTFNRANMIMDTLESVFDQTYDNFEIIVVDNCSTDNTVQILQPLVEEGKIRLIKNKENIERSRARNVGFKEAKGDFLTLLDSDDFMYPDNLKDAFKHVEEGKDIDFFHNYCELVDDNKELIRSYSYPSASKQIVQLAKGNFISCIGVFLSRKAFETYQFNEDENVIGSEDWELWVRVRSEYKLGVIPKVNSAIRNHPGRSITAYDIASILERKLYIIDHLMKNEEVRKVFGRYEKEMKVAAYMFTAITANEAKKQKEGRKYLSMALRQKASLLLSFHFWRICRKSFF